MSCQVLMQGHCCKRDRLQQSNSACAFQIPCLEFKRMIEVPGLK